MLESTRSREGCDGPIVDDTRRDSVRRTLEKSPRKQTRPSQALVASVIGALQRQFFRQDARKDNLPDDGHPPLPSHERLLSACLRCSILVGTI
eukprot:scaffold1322_cov372-Pavlova_lutheri.AAC.17